MTPSAFPNGDANIERDLNASWQLRCKSRLLSLPCHRGMSWPMVITECYSAGRTVHHTCSAW